MAFIEPISETLAKIKVVGIGGGGSNAVSSMVDIQQINGVQFIAMNTDLQALNACSAQVRVQLGPDRTHGLGSGADPEVGGEAAAESIEEIKAHLQGADMIFIAAGLGGGTGTGAAPIVAQIARDLGALTVGVVTKPFAFEGKRRMNQAEQGVNELRTKVDALIVIPNEKLLEIVPTDVPLRDAFRIADEVIGNAVQGISDLITSTGLINVDFADVKTIMKNAGSALMGIGHADGEQRAQKAAEMAVKSPLLDVDIEGSTGILLNIVGDTSLTMHEVNTAAKIVAESAHKGANIIFGADVDPEIEGIRVTVIATGFDTNLTELQLDGLRRTSDEELLNQIDSRFNEDGEGVETDDKFDDINSGLNKNIHVTGEDDDEIIAGLREEVKKMEKVEPTVTEEPKPVSNNGNGSKSSSTTINEPQEEKAPEKKDFWSILTGGK